MTERSKVFCIGFHKTGTTSLYSALKLLGYRVTGTIGHKLSADELTQTGAELCIRTMKNFDAAEDMPWPHFFAELDAAYPGSKFILTLRNLESWHRSVDNHFGDQTTTLNIFAYGEAKAEARTNKDHWIATHKAHLDRVRSYFAARPDDLLELDLFAGDGWEKLCPFLNCAEPDEPFPVKNTSAGRKSLAYRIKRKALMFAGRTPHPERLL